MVAAVVLALLGVVVGVIVTVEVQAAIAQDLIRLRFHHVQHVPHTVARVPTTPRHTLLQATQHHQRPNWPATPQRSVQLLSQTPRNEHPVATVLPATSWRRGRRMAPVRTQRGITG